MFLLLFGLMCPTFNYVFHYHSDNISCHPFHVMVVFFLNHLSCGHVQIVYLVTRHQCVDLSTPSHTSTYTYFSTNMFPFTSLHFYLFFTCCTFALGCCTLAFFWLTAFFLYYSFMFSFNSHSYLRTFSFVPLNTLPTTRFSFLLSSVWQRCIHSLIST